MLQALLSQSAHVIPNSLFPPGCRRRGDRASWAQYAAPNGASLATSAGN